MHYNASNLFRMVGICIGMFRIPFEWLEFALEWFESLSNGGDLVLKASNLFRMVLMYFGMLRILFE